MFVRGHRVGNEVSGVRIAADAIRIEYIIVAVVIAIPMLIIALAVMLASPKKKRR